MIEYSSPGLLDCDAV